MFVGRVLSLPANASNHSDHSLQRHTNNHTGRSPGIAAHEPDVDGATKGGLVSTFCLRFTTIIIPSIVIASPSNT